jgi:2-phosphoglycerate kinase
LRRLSTDYLREVQRLYVPADQCPVLAKVSHTAWELADDATPGGIVAGFSAIRRRGRAASVA